ncbi:MAG: hypothetical protein A3H57_01655 [Candidatus Taylorbacteria bacterium RIFCSPLOWO2_02_FULL_43_11]|uniref:Type II secretion system protein GspG C-terminal domain-containing protein n=1 Tax=Candidatus Taylorbacteria bacterium RIFCSPHIGHO2_02_FULL_46_13 TaxID=1802312 RepID=A0A1G2MRQ2_9BACT|nr:MAG: hypothetical protein A3C06_03195 [Candidatus Taylorbacteria bacterium RIFCSPHIGHO2_02_FULL_46_13]OHA36767.1 MAG: hypothetical protein A3H57_01655 [Candidatus Taylorbacteria bacterium RIFCSPLOWO2_02_FULL_43_11]
MTFVQLDTKQPRTTFTPRKSGAGFTPLVEDGIALRVLKTLSSKLKSFFNTRHDLFRTRAKNTMPSYTTGFTLIELSVVVVVIVIIVSVVLVNFNDVRKNARDKQRVSDMAHLQLAIEQYYDDTVAYPMCGVKSLCYSNGSYAGDIGPIINLAISPTYMRIIPVDPLNQTADYYLYYYARGYRKDPTDSNNCPTFTGNTNDYVLATRLERQPAGPCSFEFMTTALGKYPNLILGNE